jgi:subtilisin family serine protease
LGVASVDQYSRLSSFSSRGPGIGTEKFPLLKPDISAPGDRVKSTWIDGSFKLLSGTSMACPHIAGVIALMLSANPNLEYEVIYDILRRTATTELKAPTGRTACDGVEATDFPNYHYGHGLVDAYAAVKEAQKEVGFGFDLTL